MQVVPNSEGTVASPPTSTTASSSNSSTTQKMAGSKRGWKFDNPCLMCKKGNSKILGTNAELPCTCGGKPSKKRSITAEAFNPFAVSSSSFVPPTKVASPPVDVADTPASATEPPQMVLPTSRPTQMLSHSAPSPYQSNHQRPLSFARPIPTQMSQHVPMQYHQPLQQHPQPSTTPPQAGLYHHPSYPSVHTPMQMPSPHMLPPPTPPQSLPPQSIVPQQQPNNMGAILCNILDEMKQLSAITQQLKEEHNSFVDQVDKLKKKNRDMQQLIDVGTEPISAFVQVAQDDLTTSDVMALLRARAATAMPPAAPMNTTNRPSRPRINWDEIFTPCVITDSTKPFMVFRPVNLELTPKEMTQLCEQNRLGKSARNKLRVDRIAVSESFCKLLNYPREDLLQTKNPRKIIRSKHKKHFYIKVAPHLFKPAKSPVSPILAFEPRFRTKEGTILFTASKMQIFYNESGTVSFFIVCIETILKTHVPRYLEVKQRQHAKNAKNISLTNTNCASSLLTAHTANNNNYNNKMRDMRKTGGTSISSRRGDDEVYRIDEDFELSPEDEAFLEGATYPYYLPQASRQPFFNTGAAAANLADNQFASPVGSPHEPSSFSPPASPVGGGGISVGTLKEFDTLPEDYSWLLSDVQNSSDHPSPLPLSI